MGNNTEVLEQTCGICEEDYCKGCEYDRRTTRRMEAIDWLRDIFDVATDVSRNSNTQQR